MANQRTYPCLPCRDLEQVIAFYEALGLESGLKRFADAPRLDYARALLYRAELAVRLDDQGLAQSSLSSVFALELGEELAQTSELVLGGEL